MLVIMALVKNVPAQQLIQETAQQLRQMKECEQPAWSTFVKTGVHVQRPPVQEDWWYLRSASMLRKLYVDGALGVSRLRKVYGGRKNRGHKPEHKYPASGAIIRRIFKQLEAAGLVKTEKGKGRTLTPKGQAFLDSVAKSLKK